MVDVAGEAAARSADHPSDAEVELLWAGASTAPDVRRVAAAARDARLEYVLDVADRQRVGPLLLRSLGSAGVDLETLRSDAIGRAQLWGAHAKLALPAAATAALQPLNEAGLRPLVLKGLALVDRYPAPGLRPMDDIDLLLPREVIRPAAKVLLGAGWRQISHQQPDPGYDVALRHPSAPGVPLELHYELARWQERTNDIDARRVWAARTPLEVFGRPAWGLPPELELVTLIAHAAKRFHLFRRLLWSERSAWPGATCFARRAASRGGRWPRRSRARCSELHHSLRAPACVPGATSSVRPDGGASSPRRSSSRRRQGSARASPSPNRPAGRRARTWRPRATKTPRAKQSASRDAIRSRRDRRPRF